MAAALACGLFAFGSQAGAAGCFAQPSACGYPDATNTGVPAGTALTPATTKTITTNGAVISGLEIVGTVTVAADNVTIKNSRIVATRGGSGSYAVILNQGADDFTIEHTEVVGPAGESNGLESAVWNHYRNPGVVARFDYFHHCADCWEGSGRFENDYMVVDADYPGSHNEDIYVCGGAVQVEHSTLLNTFPQTATVFGDTAGCGGNTFEVENSLLAGGGYTLYPQANAGSPVGTMNISGNRFARCTDGAHYDAASGGTYCDGRIGDSNGYYPYGGFFGLAAYYFSGGSRNIWTGNVWDDSSLPVCANGSEGCGSATPPPVGPPAEEPMSEPPAEEPPSGGGETSAPVEAILSLPGRILAEVPVVLDGTDSSGPGSLSCSWSIQTAAGTFSRSGCLATYTFSHPGESAVELTVYSGAGSDSTREDVTVLDAPDGSGAAAPSGQSPPRAPRTTAKLAEAVPAGAGRSGTGPDARSAWKAPARVRPRVKLRLLARVAGDGATCTWTIARHSRHSRPFTRHGCRASLRTPARGTLSVRLTIRAADGALSTARRTIRVAAAPARKHG